MISISSNKKNWEKLKKHLIKNQNKELQIGFFKEDSYSAENNYLPVAAVAAWQDKGAPFVGPQHIPARPFMTYGLKEILHSSVYTSMYKKAMLNILSGGSVLSEYKKISVAVVPALQKVIDAWSVPPNAASTIAQKGEDNPLIDTGKMRDSVKAKIGDSK